MRNESSVEINTDGNKGHDRYDKQLPERRTEQHLEIRAEGQVDTVCKLVLVDADVVQSHQQENGDGEKDQRDKGKGDVVCRNVVLEIQQRGCGDGEALSLIAVCLQIRQVILTESCFAIVRIAGEIEVHVVGIDIVHVVVIFIIAHYLENDVALEYGTLVVDQIERLILVQILQYHVVVVFFRYVLVFDPVVILCGYRHQTVQNLYDDDGDEEAAVLLEIEENALPCNGQAPFQVLKKLFQIRNVTESRRTHASTRARSIGESLSVPCRFGRTARERPGDLLAFHLPPFYRFPLQ